MILLYGSNINRHEYSITSLSYYLKKSEHICDAYYEFYSLLSVVYILSC